MVAGHGLVCLAVLLGVLRWGLPYSTVVLLSAPVLLASAGFDRRVYLVMAPPALAAAAAAVLLRAPDLREGLTALTGLAVTVAASAEILFRLGRGYRTAQEQAQNRAGLLDALHATTVGLLERGPADDLLEDLLRRACQLLGTPHGNLFLVEGDRMRCRSAVGATRWMQEEGFEVLPGQGLSGRVWETGRPVVVQDYAHWPYRLSDPRLEAVRHAAAMPLRVGGEVRGVVVVVRTEPDRPFTPEEVQLVERFAELASLVAHNADLHRRSREELVRRQQAEAELLHKHELLRTLHATTEELLRGSEFDSLLGAIVQRGTALLRATHGNLYLREGGVMRCRVGVGAARWAVEAGVRLRCGEGMVGRVWETGQPLVVEDYATWPGRLAFPQVADLGPAVAVPLRVGLEVAGAFFVARGRGEPPFTEDEQEAASRFAHLASLVLRQAYLHQQARDELRHRQEVESRLRRRQELLEALHTTTQGLLAGFGTEELLRAVVQRACQLLGTPHGNLYLLEDGVLRCHVGLGAMAWAGDEGLVVHRGEGMVGRVWETGEPLVVEDYATWPGRLPDPRFDTLGSAVSVPLVVGSEFAGVFSVARDRTAPPLSADEVEVVARFGQLASLVLQNARLVEQARAAARAVEEQRAFYEEILNQVESEIAVFDPQMRYVYVNPAAVRDPDLRRWIIGRDDYDYCRRKGRDPALAARRQESLRRAIEERRVVEHEETVTTPTGEERYYVRRACPVVDQEGRVVRVIGYGLDITDRKRAELRLAYLALHDGLTGLANRTLFLDRVGHALERARRAGNRVALLFVDLDRFKKVNDTLGHEAGDRLLQQAADRLRSCLREADTLARLAGDEFTILLEDVPDAQAALQVAERVRAALQRPFVVAGQELTVTASVGVALSSPEPCSPEDLLRRSDAAMYQAKSLGRDRYQLFSESPERLSQV